MLEDFTTTVKMRIHVIQHLNNQFIFVKFFDEMDDVIISHLFTNNNSHAKHITQKNEEQFEIFIDQLLHEFNFLTHLDQYNIEIYDTVTSNKTTKLYGLFQSLYNNMKEKNVIMKYVY